MISIQQFILFNKLVNTFLLWQLFVSYFNYSCKWISCTSCVAYNSFTFQQYTSLSRCHQCVNELLGIVTFVLVCVVWCGSSCVQTDVRAAGWERPRKGVIVDPLEKTKQRHCFLQTTYWHAVLSFVRIFSLFHFARYCSSKKDLLFNRWGKGIQIFYILQ